jgi:hypothetical protein
VSHWNHRVIRRVDPDPREEYCQIHEVYYEEDGSIRGWTENAVRPFGESRQDLVWEIEHYLIALKKPVLCLRRGTGVSRGGVLRGESPPPHAASAFSAPGSAALRGGNLVPVGDLRSSGCGEYRGRDSCRRGGAGRVGELPCPRRQTPGNPTAFGLV